MRTTPSPELLMSLSTGDEGENAPEHPLLKQIKTYYHDPLGFVRFAFPWGQKGTELENEPGPDIWQEEALTYIGEQSKLGNPTIRVAAASGHGIGKGAYASWLVIWFGSTRMPVRGIVTANTKDQLSAKTWAELSKWHQLAINKHWFEWSATAFKFKGAPEANFTKAQPWSKNRPTAFAGTHSTNVLYIFDEASEIDTKIWETAEGAMTQPGALWVVLGNPTQSVGRFAECWGRFKLRWKRWNIDARKCRMSSQDKALHAQWAEDYGEDSDFYRVRVKGQFPRVSMQQFISTELVEKAQERVIKRESVAAAIPRLMGIDPGASGLVLSSCAVCRQGPLVIPESLTRYSIADQMDLAAQFARLINDWMPDIVFIDAHGIGKAIYDRLIQLGYMNVIAVTWGDIKETLDRTIYGNQRAECWDRTRMWLKSGSLPMDVDLKTDLTAPKVIYDSAHRMWVEPKEAMHRRQVDSPHSGDALALTFAEPIPMKRDDDSLGMGRGYVEPDVA